MKKHSILTLTILITILINLSAQNKQQYLDDIKTLSSNEFYGRGYVKNGDKIASEYIAKRFEEIGLKPIAGNDNFFQEVNFSINTFPNEINVSIGKKKLNPVTDFLIMPDARSVKGEFNLVMYSNNLKESLDTIKNKKIFLVADESNLKDLDFNYIFDGFYPGLGGLIILTENKMIWGTSQDQEEHFIMTIQKSEFDNNAKTISVDARTKFISNYKSRNVIGVIPAKKAKGSIFITAHYDHLGMLGNIVFNGANDNASGVAMLLQLAESFSKKKFSNFNIVFIAFTGEEAGLVGSYQYTEEPLIPLDEIRFLVNLDLMGDGKNGIGVVNATIFQKEYKILEKINSQNSYFTNINKRGKSANSDHYFFTERGVPSFFIYSESKELAYHTPDDNFENFIPGKFNEMYKLLNSFIRSLK